MKQEAIKSSQEYLAEVPSPFTGFASWLRAAAEKIAPVGYQDETGFHLGPQPAPEAAGDFESGRP